MVQLTNKTNLGEILSLYPETQKVFRKYGIPTGG